METSIQRYAKFMLWAKEEHRKNRDEREAYKDERLSFDDYVRLNLDYLTKKYAGVKHNENNLNGTCS